MRPEAELNRAIVKAQDENQYYYTDNSDTNGKLKVDLEPMITKSRFAEKAVVWIRMATTPKCINVALRGTSWGSGTIIPIDDNIIFYSGSSTIAAGSFYDADSNGLLVYQGVNKDSTLW